MMHQKEFIKAANKIVYFVVLALILCLCFSCGTPEPKAVSFTGQWKQIFENCISGNQVEVIKDVYTDGNRFRIEDENEVVVYDGTYIYTKSKKNMWADENMPVQTNEISKNQSNTYKFWLTHSGAKAGPGGNIAGQETILYTSKLKKPEGEFALQCWIDAKTGINLKDSHTIYSKQIGQMVTRETTECMQIEYAPIDDSAFTKPE